MRITHTIKAKKWLALAGLVWFVYVIFHVASLLIFHAGAEAFNRFYATFSHSPMYWLMVLILALSLIFHIIVAIDRQVLNHLSGGESYQKPYPKAVPRVIAWGGVSVLLGFVIFHIVQMQLIGEADLYAQIGEIFAQPIMWLIYALGLFSLGAHLHHGLSNVLQTLGISAKQPHWTAAVIVLLLMSGFVSILIRAIYR